MKGVLRGRIVRSCPQPEILNLLSGGALAAAINLLSAATLHSNPGGEHFRIITSGWLLLVGGASGGILGVIIGRRRAEALDYIGPTLTRPERRSLINRELEKSALPILILSSLVLLALVLGLLLLI